MLTRVSDFTTYTCSILVLIHLITGVAGAFIRRGHSKEGGVHKLFLIIERAFIGGRRLKDGGRLLEDLLKT